MRIRRNYTVSTETDQKLREIAKKTGLKLSTIIDLAVKAYGV